MLRNGGERWWDEEVLIVRYEIDMDVRYNMGNTVNNIVITMYDGK